MVPDRARCAAGATDCCSPDYSMPSHAPESVASPAALPTEEDLSQIYQDAMEQGRELVISMEPRASPEEVERIALKMAEEAVHEEIKAGWHQSGAPGPERAPSQVPEIRACRRKQGPDAPPAPERGKAKATRERGHHWQRWMQLIISRKRWSVWGMARQYSLLMPRNIDGRARGLGRHLGRWSWREVRDSW